MPIVQTSSHQGFVTGRSIAGVTAACTYLVARKEGVPRQIAEICETFQVDEKELSRMIRHISRKFNMHKISCPSDYFGRFISDLKLPPKTSLEVDALWEAMKPHVDIWQGKKPMGVAAAIIYKAATKSWTQENSSRYMQSSQRIRGYTASNQSCDREIVHYAGW